MSTPLRLAFAGTPGFALAALDAMLTARHEVVGVWTQPDRPAGRGRKLAISPVKQRALELGLAVHQPRTLKSVEAQLEIRAVAADAMVVVAYGLLLPVAVLSIPRFGCLNLHASLLPRWRGAAPIQRALLAGDTETGVTIMQMDQGLDTGDILMQSHTPIEPHDNAQSLHERLAMLGATALLQVLQQLPSVPRHKQDDAHATYAGKLSKEEARLDWKQPAQVLACCVRAYNPWPMAYTLYADAPLRIWQAAALDMATQQPPGTVLVAGRDGIDVATGDGVLRIIELQPAGRRVMSAADFSHARPLAGTRFG